MADNAHAAPTEFHIRLPGPRLAGLVTRISGWRAGAPLAEPMREPASLVCPLIVTFDGSFGITLDRAAPEQVTSFASGLHDGRVEIAAIGRPACVQIDFTPIGARRFFALPMGEMASRLVPLDCLDGSHSRELADRLAEPDDWPSRLALAEDIVFSRIAAAQPLDAKLVAAWNLLSESRRDIRIAAIGEKLDWTRKQMAQTVRREFGLSPKTVARIARFERAHRIVMAGGNAFLADIAFDCGYADQAHMTREFADFAGSTPGALLA